MRVRHKDLPGGVAWLVFEWFAGEAEPRWYLTNADASNRKACVAVIALYRNRRKVEETFRFLKVYRVCRGIAKIAEHVANPPRPKPEKRPKKGDCVQPTLKLSF